MGFLDNVTDAVNRGTASAGRTAEKVKLKAQLSELSKKRQQLAAQLGASLYEATRNDATFRKGREALYDEIASCDASRDEMQEQIKRIDTQAAASATLSCPVCGATVATSDLFCSGCGTSIEQIRSQSASNGHPAPQSSTFCMNCGSPLGADDAFCMKCGTKAGAMPHASSEECGKSPDSTTESAEVEADETTELPPAPKPISSEGDE